MSNSLTRKVRRQKSNKIKKDLDKQIKRQVSLFARLPEVCFLCGTMFDKKSRGHHMTWQVKVYEESNSVVLRCPDCLEKKGDK